MDAADVRQALEHPDVVEVGSSDGSRVYGRNLRPVDGPAWTIREGPSGLPAAPS